MVTTWFEMNKRHTYWRTCHCGAWGMSSTKGGAARDSCCVRVWGHGPGVKGGSWAGRKEASMTVRKHRHNEPEEESTS